MDRKVFVESAQIRLSSSHLSFIFCYFLFQVHLVRTRSAQYTREDITRIFGDSTLASHSVRGKS